MDTTTDHFTPLALRVRGNDGKGFVNRQKLLQNSKGYAESPEFSPVLGLVIFGEKSVTTNMR